MRDLFSIPREHTYLNAAAYGPLPRAVREAGMAGAAAKSMPWTAERPNDDLRAERVRAAVAELIGAGAEDVAILGSVSQGMAIAGRSLAPGIAPGSRILRVAGEQSSQALEWQRLAAATGAVVDVVPRPADHDWTSAILDRIAEPGLPPVSVAALTPLHWTDGALIDLDRIAPAVRSQGGALVVDATQAAGAMPIDVRRWQPDFLAFPTYKWLLGSYNLAFLYAAPGRQDGEPLDRNAFNCGTDDAVLDTRPLPGARRYDMGERNNPVALPMAEVALGLIHGWGVPAIEAGLRPLTDALADAAEALGLAVVPRRFRAPHILGVRIAGGAAATHAMLASHQVHVSDRQGVLRISPHVYNDAADVERFAQVLAAVVQKAS